MNKSALALASLFAVAAMPVLAQQGGGGATSSPNQGSTMSRGDVRMPYQSGFWNYVGVAGGVSRYDTCGGGLSCDKSDSAWKVYTGGKFNEMFGFEVGYNDFGSAQLGGGSVEARGLNFSMLAGMPIGANSGIFGKVGTTYGETRVSAGAPGFAAGKERDWGISYGAGAHIGLNQNWQVRLDWDRTRFQFVSGKKNVDAVTVGLQYKF